MLDWRINSIIAELLQSIFVNWNWIEEIDRIVDLELFI